MSPLVAEPFVGEHLELDTFLMFNTSQPSDEFLNLSSFAVGAGNTSLVGYPPYQVDAESRIYIPFAICGAANLMMVIPLSIFWAKKAISGRRTNKEASMQKRNMMGMDESTKKNNKMMQSEVLIKKIRCMPEMEEKKYMFEIEDFFTENRNLMKFEDIVTGLDVHLQSQKDSDILCFLATGAAAVFEFCDIAFQEVFIGFVAMFSVTYLDWSAAEGAVVSSVFWGCYLVSRILAIPVSKFVSPVKMLGGLLFILSASAIALFVGMAKHDLVLWVGAGSVGIAHRPMCPTVGLSLNHYVKVVGRTASILIFFGAMGGMAIPAIIGQFLQNNQPIAFPSFLITVSGTMVMLYLIKIFLYSRFRKSGH